MAKKEEILDWTGNLHTTLSTCVRCSMEIQNPSSNSILKDSLSTIFKLNYLNAFESTECHKEEEEIRLCLDCTTLLGNLQQLYNDFLQIGQLESALSKKLSRLDKIMEDHLERRINCDYLPILKPIDHQPLHESTINFKLEPRIILTRLPENCCQPNNLLHNDQEIDDHLDYGLSDCDEGEFANSVSEKSSEPEKQQDEDVKKCTKIVENSSRYPKRRSSQRVKPVKEKKTKVNKKSPVRSKKRSKKDLKPVTPKTSEKVPNCEVNPRNSVYYRKRAKYANPCWYCKSHFPTQPECVEHTKTEHLPKDHKTVRVCERCSKMCWNEGYWNLHKKKCETIPSGVVLPKEFQCPQCSKSFRTRHCLKHHSLSHKSDREFSCDLCHYEGKTLTAVTTHKKKKHFSVNSPVKCDVCEKVMKSAETLQVHKFNIHDPEGHQKYREDQVKQLAKRREKRRLNASQKTTICADCGDLDMHSRLGYLNHRRSFHGDNIGEWVCEKCGRDFSDANRLKAHMDGVHTDARPYLCTTCGKEFKNAQNLKAHDDHTHTTEGRLKYNEQMRERNRRKKALERELANKKLQNQTQTLIKTIQAGDWTASV